VLPARSPWHALLLSEGFAPPRGLAQGAVTRVIFTIGIAEEDRRHRWRALTAMVLTAGLFPLSLIGWRWSPKAEWAGGAGEEE